MCASPVAIFKCVVHLNPALKPYILFTERIMKAARMLYALLWAGALQGANAFAPLALIRPAAQRGRQLDMAQTTSRFRPTVLPPTKPPQGRIPFNCNVLNSGVINVRSYGVLFGGLLLFPHPHPSPARRLPPGSSCTTW